jgi:hypothetical protein
MLKDRLKKLFEHCDPEIQAIISSVLVMEQEYISMERPRVKDEVDSIISLAARKKLERAGTKEPME